MSDTVETPTVCDLHTKALDAMHAAIAAVQAFLGHPDVVDDTTMHAAAKNADYEMGGALRTMQGLAQVVVATDPLEEGPPPEPEHQPAVEA